jgi:hypothetical protein
VSAPDPVGDPGAGLASEMDNGGDGHLAVEGALATVTTPMEPSALARFVTIRGPLLAGIAAVMIVSVFFGIRLRPTVTGPPPLAGQAAPPVVTVNLTRNLTTSYEYFERIISCADKDSPCSDSLEISIGDTSTAPYSATIQVLGLGGACPAPLTSDHIDSCAIKMPATTPKNLAQGSGPTIGIDLDLSYPSGTFYRRDGAYASGLVPGLQLLVNNGSGANIATGRAYQMLNINGTEQPAQFTLLQGPEPAAENTGSGQYDWYATSNSGAPAVSFTTTNPYQVEVDSRNGFLSGILFGVAGSALVTLLAEALRIERRRGRDAAGD